MIAEHAVPAYVPEAMGRVTHWVTYDHPKRPGDTVTTTIDVPCVSEAEAKRFAKANKRLRMRNVRVLTAAEWAQLRGGGK